MRLLEKRPVPNVTTADVAKLIVMNDKTSALAQAGQQMRVGRVADETHDGNVKVAAATRSSVRLKEFGRSASVGCSESLATQKAPRILRSFSEGVTGTSEAFFEDLPAADEHVEAANALQTLANISYHGSDSSST